MFKRTPCSVHQLLISAALFSTNLAKINETTEMMASLSDKERSESMVMVPANLWLVTLTLAFEGLGLHLEMETIKREEIVQEIAKIIQHMTNPEMHNQEAAYDIMEAFLRKLQRDTQQKPEKKN